MFESQGKLPTQKTRERNLQKRFRKNAYTVYLAVIVKIFEIRRLLFPYINNEELRLLKRSYIKEQVRNTPSAHGKCGYRHSQSG